MKICNNCSNKFKPRRSYYQRCWECELSIRRINNEKNKMEIYRINEIKRKNNEIKRELERLEHLEFINNREEIMKQNIKERKEKRNIITDVLQEFSPSRLKKCDCNGEYKCEYCNEDYDNIKTELTNYIIPDISSIINNYAEENKDRFDISMIVMEFIGYEGYTTQILSYRRIITEVRDMNINKLNISPYNDNLYIWNMIIKGPDNSAYEGKKYILRMTYGFSYPFTPPKYKFITKIFHPNVDYKTGNFWYSDNDKKEIEKHSIANTMIYQYYTILKILLDPITNMKVRNDEALRLFINEPEIYKGIVQSM